MKHGEFSTDKTLTRVATANFVLAGPTSGSPAASVFRALVAADIPSLSISSITGTMAQFDTACADGNFVYQSQALGTPSSGVATNLTGLPLASGISGFGTGVAASLAVNIGSAGAPVLFNGALGTPAAAVLTNCTGLPVASGISGLGTGVAAALAVNIGSAGAFVVNGGALGTPSSGVLTNCTFPTLNQNTTGSAATLTTTRTIWGQNFNGSANVSGTLALGVSDLTLTGSIGATGARATKVWTAALESTAMPTVGGTSLSSTFSPIAGSASIVTVGTVTTGTWSATAIAANKGGTGQTTYAVGDLLYASTTSALSKLAGVATGNALISGGVNTAPSWGKIALTTHVSGTLPVANGGTGVTSSTGSGNNVLSASPTFSGTVTTRAISLTGSGGTPDTISFGANSGSAAIWLYDNFPNRVGFGANSFELQAFMGNSDHFSWNKGGAMQAVGTNEVARLEAVGNFKIGASTARGTTEGTNQIVLFNGTAPAGTLTNGGSIFCAGGEIKVADAAGNITQISPHDNDGNWIHSETNYKGRVLRVDMERLVKAIDKLLGGGFVQEFLIDE